jgi:peptidoglycan hydrolase CwlO-like protein
MESSTRLLGRALLAAALAAAVAAGGPRPAAATDLETMRARAQKAADEVSALEHRRDALDTRRQRLQEGIAAYSQQVALLESAISETRARVERAKRRYVARAIEAYKQGPTARLAILLSAHDLAGVLTAAEAASKAAEHDAGALRGLVDALDAENGAQDEVDATKQRLLTAKARNDAVIDEIASTLAARRATLRRLSQQVAELAEQARLRALEAARPDAAFRRLLEPSGPAASIPKGYVSTGVTFEGLASWYGPGFEGQATANGQVFDPNLYTAASRDLPFGTTLFVQHDGRGVVVVINDRGPYIKERILDLSRAAAEAIGISGVEWVSAEIVVPAHAG